MPIKLITADIPVASKKAILKAIFSTNIDWLNTFRAPALRVNEYTVQALHKTGFLIDSSIASQRFDMFMSLGTIKKFNR